MAFDLEKIRADFPILERPVHGKRLVYLDNAATTLKPQSVVDVIKTHYALGSANVHRGVHYLSEEATQAFESARETVAKYVNAASSDEIVFTSGTTMSINLVANSYLKGRLKQGDEILVTGMEHHANIVPWHLLSSQTGCVLKAADIDDRGVLNLDHFESLLNERTKLVSVVQVSNALGTINPVKQIIDLAHQRGIPVLIDGAQAVAHSKVDVQALDADFYAFSAHKIFGPTGFGILYGKRELLETMPPFLGGGEMIRSVTFEESTFAPIPLRFEAGTPHIAGAIGLGAALHYVQSIGLDAIKAYESELLAYGTEQLSSVKGLRLIGTSPEKASILSFVIDGVHPHDLGSLVDQEGVAIRTGHHCAQPVMKRFNVPATARASLSFYNTKQDIDDLVVALDKAREIFA